MVTKRRPAIWEVLYCYDGFQYRPLKSFVSTAKRTGGEAARTYREKLLKTPKYKGKEEVLWVERYTGSDAPNIWM